MNHSTVRDARVAFLHIHGALTRTPPKFLHDQPRAAVIRSMMLARRERFFEEYHSERDADAFNHAFFFKNLYKCLLATFAFRALGLTRDTQVWDIGSGAGPFSLAWNAAFPSRQNEIVLVDPSRSQLESAAQALSAVGVRDFRLVRRDFLSYGEYGRGIGLASYWLCTQQNTSVRHIVNRFGAEPLLVLDYESVIEWFAASLPPSFVRTDLRLRGMDLPIRNPQLFSDHEINVAATLFRPKAA